MTDPPATARWYWLYPSTFPAVSG